MKKFYSFVMVAACALVSAISVNAQDFTVDDINYTVTGGTEVQVTGCTTMATSAIIPQTVQNGTATYTVTSIKSSAFASRAYLTEISFPEGIREIPQQCCFSCSSLEKVTIPSTVSNIGMFAFYMCTKIREIYCYAMTPPTCGTNVFQAGIYTTSTLYIPSDSYMEYVESSPWSTFQNKEHLPTTGIGSVVDDTVVEGQVEYFDLTGRRIANPAAGQMVIKRQGSKATKMLVK